MTASEMIKKILRGLDVLEEETAREIYRVQIVNTMIDNANEGWSGTDFTVPDSIDIDELIADLIEFEKFGARIIDREKRLIEVDYE